MSDLTPAAPADARQPAPWGLLATIVWGTISVVVWFAVQFTVILGYVMVYPDAAANMKALTHDGFLLAFVTIVAAPAWVAVAALAARWRGWPVRDYLALIPPRRAEIAFGIACLAALLIAFDALTYFTGRDIVPAFMVEAYSSARAAGSLVLFFIAVVVMAPIAEEVAFRGFLFRGFSASWLGVGGTLIATSAAWAMMHVQYDWFTLGQIFCIGLLLGWLRWASGSTLLTILLHMLANLTACIQAAIRVEWMG